MMDQNQKDQVHSLTIVGGVLLVISFAVYYQLMYEIEHSNSLVINLVSNLGFKLSNSSISKIYSRGTFIGLFLTFLGIGFRSKNIIFNNLFYYPIATFFIVLFFIYTINDIFTYLRIDNLLETNKMILSFIITTVLCFIYYLRFLKWD